MKQDQIIFGAIMMILSLLGQYIHLLSEANKMSSQNKALGLPFSFRNDLIRKDFFAIQMACLLNIVLIGIYCYGTRNYAAPDFEKGLNLQEITALLLSLTFGYSGSSLGLKILNKTDSLFSQQVDNFDINIINKTDTKMESWYLGFRTEQDEIKMDEGDNKSLSEFAQYSSGKLDGVVIQYESQPSFLQVDAIEMPAAIAYLAVPTRKPPTH